MIHYSIIHEDQVVFIQGIQGFFQYQNQYNSPISKLMNNNWSYKDMQKIFC